MIVSITLNAGACAGRGRRRFRQAGPLLVCVVAAFIIASMLSIDAETAPRWRVTFRHRVSMAERHISFSPAKPVFVASLAPNIQISRVGFFLRKRVFVATHWPFCPCWEYADPLKQSIFYFWRRESLVAAGNFNKPRELASGQVTSVSKYHVADQISLGDVPNPVHIDDHVSAPNDSGIFVLPATNASKNYRVERNNGRRNGEDFLSMRSDDVIKPGRKTDDDFGHDEPLSA